MVTALAVATRRRLYELMKNRSQLQPQDPAKPLEKPDPEHRQNAYLTGMNEPQKFQRDTWSHGSV